MGGMNNHTKAEGRNRKVRREIVARRNLTGGSDHVVKSRKRRAPKGNRDALTCMDVTAQSY